MSLAPCFSPQRRISTYEPFIHDANPLLLANERTYLAYLRTSSAFATLGTTVRQLFLLQNQNGSSSTASSPYGQIMAIACLSFAAIVALSGAFRFWRQQNAMARAKVHAGGWEVCTAGLAGLVVSLSFG